MVYVQVDVGKTKIVLKLTLSGHYGIILSLFVAVRIRFWSWPYRVIMVYTITACTNPAPRSEVDPIGSLWYTSVLLNRILVSVLKLTLSGHYGILNSLNPSWRNQFWSWPYRVIMVYNRNIKLQMDKCSEVDPIGSLWYNLLQSGLNVSRVLKLTLSGHYGIQNCWLTHFSRLFWSWPYRVIMV